MCTAIEVANRIMKENESSREEVTIDLVLLPPDSVDLLTDDEDVRDNISNNEFPSEIAGSIEIAIEGTENVIDDVSPDPTFSNENMQVDRKGAEVLKALTKVDQLSNIRLKWSETPSSDQPMLSPVEGISKGITDATNAAIEILEGKEPHEVFEYYFNEELKDCIITETNSYASQQNDLSFRLSKDDLNSFVGILLLSGYHSLPRTRIYWEKEDISK